LDEIESLIKSPKQRQQNSIQTLYWRGVTKDANWDEKILEPLEVKHTGNEAFVTANF
jgi:hypothetical protein